MSFAESFAVSLPSVDNLGQFLLRALAVAGGALVGGLLVGLLTQLLCRLLTARKVPPSALRFVRVLGGAVFGVLVALWVFGSGSGSGWGFGGGGGPGPGNGGEHSGKDQPPKDQPSTDRPQPADRPPTKDGEPVPKPTALQIEVLAGTGPQPQGRYYKVEGEREPKTLEEIATMLPALQKQNPALEKVVVVLYESSPDRDTAVVQGLLRVVKDNHLTHDVSSPPGERRDR